MKMSKERYELLKDAIRAVAEDIGYDICRSYAQDRNDKQLMYALFHKATNQLQYDDNHPFFKNGQWKRVYPHVEGFAYYNDNGVSLNDDHIWTALKRIGKDLELTR